MHDLGAQRTHYNNATLRAFNVLVETANEKAPPQSTLGHDEALLNPKADSSGGNGHVPRNVRLSLSLIDLVQVQPLQSHSRPMMVPEWDLAGWYAPPPGVER